MADKTPEQVIAGLKADNAKLIEGIELRDGLLKKQDEAFASATAEIHKLQGELRQTSTVPDYLLTPISENSTCSRYDGIEHDGQFIWHEALSFRDDNGYSASAILDRALASVDRGLGLGSGRLNQDCAFLPPFSRDLALEVILRVVA